MHAGALDNLITIVIIFVWFFWGYKGDNIIVLFVYTLAISGADQTKTHKRNYVIFCKFMCTCHLF